MNAREVARLIDEKIKPLRGMVEFVTDLVFADDGTASASGAKTDDSDGEPLTPAVLWHLGFYSRPLDGATGVALKASGKGGVSFLVGYRNRQYEIALEKGECAMANEAGASVKLDKDGNVIVTPAAGKTVQIAGSANSLLMSEDFFADLKLFIGAMIADLASAAAAPASTYTATLNTTTFFARAVTGSGQYYKSTKAKNG